MSKRLKLKNSSSKAVVETTGLKTTGLEITGFKTATFKRTLLLLALLLAGFGSAQPFVGVFASGNYLTGGSGSDPLIVSLGAQAGVHNLVGLFGTRGTAELSVYPDFALGGSYEGRTNYHLTEFAGDALFSWGLVGVTGYAGLGGGVGRVYDAGAVQARAVAGAELAGLFAEILPTLWLQTASGAVVYDLRARAGYNFKF